MVDPGGWLCIHVVVIGCCIDSNISSGWARIRYGELIKNTRSLSHHFMGYDINARLNHTFRTFFFIIIIIDS